MRTLSLADAAALLHIRGQPIRKAGVRAWRQALARAGIEDFRWHDLRHTWASWHVQSGTPLHVLQELGGWATAAMVRRYAHLSAEHLAGYAGRIKEPIRTIPVTGSIKTANPAHQNILCRIILHDR